MGVDLDRCIIRFASCISGMFWNMGLIWINYVSIFDEFIISSQGISINLVSLFSGGIKAKIAI